MLGESWRFASIIQPSGVFAHHRTSYLSFSDTVRPYFLDENQEHLLPHAATAPPVGCVGSIASVGPHTAPCVACIGSIGCVGNFAPNPTCLIPNHLGGGSKLRGHAVAPDSEIGISGLGLPTAYSDAN